MAKALVFDDGCAADALILAEDAVGKQVTFHRTSRGEASEKLFGSDVFNDL